MKPIKATMFSCPDCGETYEDRWEADDCCPKDTAEEVKGWKCSECDEFYEDKEEAKECCKDE